MNTPDRFAHPLVSLLVTLNFVCSVDRLIPRTLFAALFMCLDVQTYILTIRV